MKFFKKIFIYFTIVFLVACQDIRFFIANFPSHFTSQYRVFKNVAYGSYGWQKLDVYVPKETKNASVILFLYGGGWIDGQKENYRFVADFFSQNGYIVIIPDYVKYPTGKFPEFMDDAARVSEWINHNIRSYKGNPNSIHLMGHSAGAYIGAMLIADQQYLQKYELKPTYFQSFIGLSGPYHFTPEEEIYKNIFSTVKDYKQMQVTSFITGDEPHMLLLHGLDDGDVGIINTKKLSRAVIEKNGSLSINYYKDVDHAGTVTAFLGLGKQAPIIQADILRFLQENQ